MILEMLLNIWELATSYCILSYYADIEMNIQIFVISQLSIEMFHLEAVFWKAINP